MAGTGRFNVIGGEALESEGGPGVLWYTRAAVADFVLCVDWRLSSLDDNGDDSRPLRGHIGLQTHHPGSRVQFRHIRIREP